MRSSQGIDRMAGWQSGSCRGLQILVHRFNSGTGLQILLSYRIYLFRLSSAVEQSAVNRLVACSNQAAGANKKALVYSRAFFYGSSCFLLSASFTANLSNALGSLARFCSFSLIPESIFSNNVTLPPLARSFSRAARVRVRVFSVC